MPTTKIGPYTIHHTDAQELHLLKREIFSQHCYAVEFATATPRILDLGAHIGLATLYFKKLYPAAIVTAVEPHPTAAALFEQNMWENDCRDVTLIAAAVVPQHLIDSDVFSLHEDEAGTWLSTTSRSAGAWNGQVKTAPLAAAVRTITLGSLLTEPVDLVKIDIEGLEQAVLSDLSAQELQRIDQLIIEFHPHASQHLDKLLKLLHAAGFTCRLTKDGSDIQIHQAQGLILIHAQRGTKRPTR